MWFIIILYLIGACIGALEMYCNTGDVMQLVIGALIGIVVTFCSILGLIPVFGVYLYQIITNGLFRYFNVPLVILYCYGLILSVLYTIIAVVAIIVIILIITDKL